MKSILISIFSVLCITTLNAQNIYFIKSYGNNGYDYGRDIKQDLDTGYIATGSSSSFSSGTADAFLLKVDSLGNFKWSYNYGGQETDWGESVVVTHDSSYAIGGYTNSFGAGGFDFYLVRADKDGTPLWEKTYGGSDWDRAHSIIQLADSGFVLAGETHSYGNGNSDIYIVRTDKNGDTLWTRTYGGSENDYANAVILDGDSLVVVGGTESFGAGMTDGIILKYHINGNMGWSKVAGMDKEDYFTSISRRQLNGDLLIGGNKNYGHYQNCDCGQDFWIYHITNNGTVLADTSWGGEQLGEEHLNDILFEQGVGNIYYAGSTTSWGYQSDNKSDAFIGKLLLNYYSTNFIKNFGVAGEDAMLALDMCYDEGIVAIGGLDFQSTGGSNVVIVRVDKNNTGGYITVTTELDVPSVITLAIEKELLKSTIEIYPNPIKNNFTINNLPLNEQILIQIYSNTGSLVFETNQIQSQYNIDDLANGLYLLKVKTKSGIAVTKIIKN